MMKNKKGFILLLVLASMAIIILSGTILINLGTNEMWQAKRDTDYMNAYYGAVAGAERIYTHLGSEWNKTIEWDNQTVSGAIAVNTSAFANYSAAANSISLSYNASSKKYEGVLGIVSTGVSDGTTSRVTVKCGYTASSVGPPPVSSDGNITLTGHQDTSDKKNPKSSTIYVEGPLEAGSGSNVTINGTSSLVTINGGSENGTAGISPLYFWRYDEFDTKNTGVVFSDLATVNNATVHLGYVNLTMAMEQAGNNTTMLDAFHTNDVNNDSVIDNKDAFTYYYTQYLDQPANNPTNTTLGIAPGEVGYFSPVTTPDSFKDHIDAHGKQTKLLDVEDSSELDKHAVPQGTEIIFVDGDLYIDKTDTKWKGGNFNHTIVCTGNVDIFQPKNDNGDTLTVIALGDVTICGKDTGNSQLNGNFIVYTAGEFTALMGGTSHNAIYAEDGVTIDTVYANKKYDRTMYNLLGTWNAPLGLPPGYRTITYNFKLDTSKYKTQWDMTNN